MSRETSLYLDLLRFSAALIVVISHFSLPRLSGGYVNFDQYGHSAVIVFFILSGYVIAYVADTKENNMKSYFISRFARIYSVVIPVLILIPLFDTIGQFINSEIYDGKTADSFYTIRLFANLSFSQEFWFFSFRYLSDGPLWSLGYEFWYYVLFGLSLFIEGKKKYFYIFLTALLIGPKILLLLPVWLLGVWIYNFHKNKELNQNIARVLFLVSLLLLLYCFSFCNEINQIVYSILGVGIQSKLVFSAGFVTDYIIGFFAGMHILSMKYINSSALNKALWGGGESDSIFCK